MITISMPGMADLYVAESGYPSDEPARWSRYEATRESRRVGRGRSITVTMDEADWLDLHDYVDSVVGALECDTGEPMDPSIRRDRDAMRVLRDRIEAQIPKAKEQRR